jgi:lipase
MPALHVHEWGDPGGEPVLCLHGVTGHGGRFRRLAQGPLARRRVLALDLRGHGRSSWEPPWGIADHVGDLAETADTLAVERADWVGHSYGGRLVAELALRAPERVRSVALLDPALGLAPALCLERAELERATIRFGSPEEAIQARLGGGTLFHTPRELLEEEMAEHLVDAGDGGLTLRYCQSTVVAAWGQMADPAPAPAQLPTLLVVGERSWIPLDEHARRYEAELGDLVRVARVPGGHLVYWDALQETGAALRDFLDEL